MALGVHEGGCTRVARAEEESSAPVARLTGPGGEEDALRPVLSPGVRVADVALLQARQRLFQLFERAGRQIRAVQVQFPQAFHACQEGSLLADLRDTI